MPQNRDDRSDDPGGPPPTDWWDQNRPPPNIVQNPGETIAQTLERYRRDYHAPDRDYVLAAIRHGRYTTTPPTPPPPPSEPPPSGGGGFNPASYHGRNDAASIRAYVDGWLAQNRAQGDTNFWNPQYWYRRIAEQGGPSPYTDSQMRFGSTHGQGGDPGGQFGRPPGSTHGQGGDPGGQFGRPPQLPAGLRSPYAPPPLPAALQQPFVPPTQAELEASPGYRERLALGREGMERSAAAKGSILSGGFQKELAQYNQDYASNEYSNLFNQRLGVRQQAAGEYNPLLFGPSHVARGVNYGEYLGNVGVRRDAQTDYWNRLNTLYQGGLTGARDLYRPPLPY